MNRRRSGFTLIELMVVIAIISVLLALILPAVQSAREAARRTQCANNLTQLGIALESYEATHNVLPPGTVDASGPIIELPTSYQFGWITQILPHLDQKAVYRNLDFHQGIYHVANQTARSVSLSILMCPTSNRAMSGSAFAACHNDVEAPIDVKNTGVFFLNSHVRLDEIDDGLAHTIFVGEKKGGAGDELGWASGTRSTLRNTGTPINGTSLGSIDFSPYAAALAEGTVILPAEGAPPLRDDEIPPEARPKRVVPALVGGFSSFHPHGANFLFGDGSVRFLKQSINSRVYRWLGARNDGQLVSDDQF
jgi:prepilin-type N-terminal cleavage/methylation domain-containing protein/prepilin-type processing-associated H-X9-DG protein